MGAFRVQEQFGTLGDFKQHASGHGDKGLLILHRVLQRLQRGEERHHAAAILLFPMLNVHRRLGIQRNFTVVRHLLAVTQNVDR
ncbi:hypothetical protein D3C79_472560 [compost metagenome]